MTVEAFIYELTKRGFNDRSTLLLARAASEGLDVRCLLNLNIKNECLEQLINGLRKGYPIYLYTDTKFTYHDIILFNDICTNLMNHPEMIFTMEEVVNYGMSLSCNLELYALCIRGGHMPTASEWKFLTKLQNETRFTRWEDRPDTKSFAKLIQYFDKFPYKYNVYQHLRTRYAIDMFAKCVDSGFNEDEILDVCSGWPSRKAYDRIKDEHWYASEIPLNNLSYF